MSYSITYHKNYARIFYYATNKVILVALDVVLTHGQVVALGK